MPTTPSRSLTVVARQLAVRPPSPLPSSSKLPISLLCRPPLVALHAWQLWHSRQACDHSIPHLLVPVPGRRHSASYSHSSIYSLSFVARPRLSSQFCYNYNYSTQTARTPPALRASPSLTRSLSSSASALQHTVSAPIGSLPVPTAMTTSTGEAGTSISTSDIVELRHLELVGSLDCGTTSVRFIVFDEIANIIAQHQLEFPQYYPHPGWHEHDALEIQRVSEECISGACEKLNALGIASDSIKVIGITNQRETAVAWDRTTGVPLCKAIVWDDSRTKGTVAHFQHKLRVEGIEVSPGEFKKGEEGIKALRHLTGLPLSTYFSAIKLCWMIQNYDEVRKAHEEDNLCFGTVDSWLVYNLTGGRDKGLHITEPTNASRTLLLDIHTLTWSPSLLRFFELRPSILPKLVSSSETYGSLTDSSPLAGVPIAGLVGDQQGALVGNKCFHVGEAKCTYGTGAFLLFCTGSEPVESEHGMLTTVAYQAGPGKEPVYALEGSIAVAGSAIKWLRDSMGMIQSAAEVNDLAAKEDSTGDVYFVTAFSGLLAPYWDPGAAGLLIGLSSYTNPSHIARATLEANAFQTRAVIESMALDSDAELKHLKVDGGMTNGDLCMQILADIGGFGVVRPEMRESTALGSALLAGSAINLFGWDVSHPSTLVHVNTLGGRTFEPSLPEEEREMRWTKWKRAVERSMGWDEAPDED